jgi:hypothetical protein
MRPRDRGRTLWKHTHQTTQPPRKLTTYTATHPISHLLNLDSINQSVCSLPAVCRRGVRLCLGACCWCGALPWSADHGAAPAASCPAWRGEPCGRPLGLPGVGRHPVASAGGTPFGLPSGLRDMTSARHLGHAGGTRKKRAVDAGEPAKGAFPVCAANAPYRPRIAV